MMRGHDTTDESGGGEVGGRGERHWSEGGGRRGVESENFHLGTPRLSRYRWGTLLTSSTSLRTSSSRSFKLNSWSMDTRTRLVGHTQRERDSETASSY